MVKNRETPGDPRRFRPNDLWPRLVRETRAGYFLLDDAEIVALVECKARRAITPVWAARVSSVCRGAQSQQTSRPKKSDTEVRKMKRGHA
jgi:hypothetical protein